MNAKEIIEMIEFVNSQVMKRRSQSLNDEQKKIIYGTLLKLQYKEMLGRWDIKSIKDKGSELWKMLSEVFKKEISKSNFQTTIEPIYHEYIGSQNQPPRDNQSDYTNDLIYVEQSPIEKQACEANCKPGSLIRIKAPHKFGKTLLLNQILKDARNKGFKTAIFDFGLLSDSTYKDYQKLCQDFCFSVGEKLELNFNDIDNWLDNDWKKRLDTNQNTTRFLQDCVLSEISVDLVLALENFDEVLELENEKIRDNFCKLLRYWFVMSKKETNTIWDRLHLIIIHSTDVYGKTDINSSPLAGVGEYFELKMFDEQQIEQLITKYNLSLNDNQKQQLINLIGGHPYLLVEVIKALKTQKITLETLLKEATTESGIFRDYLRQLGEIIYNNNELKEIYTKVINSDEPIELFYPKDVAFKLYSLGLVKLEGDLVSPSNNLYKEYFKKYLNLIDLKN